LPKSFFERSSVSSYSVLIGKILFIAPFYREIEHFVKGIINKSYVFPEHIVALFYNYPGIIYPRDIFYLREITFQHRAHGRGGIAPILLVPVFFGNPFNNKKVVELVVKVIQVCGPVEKGKYDEAAAYSQCKSKNVY